MAILEKNMKRHCRIQGPAPMHSIIIRPFNKNDLASLHRMIQGTIEASYTGIYPPRAVAFFKAYHSEGKIIERSAAGEVLVLVNQDGSILATGSLISSEITGVFVHRNYHRKGYGKAIMAELERRAKVKGFSNISLSVSLPSRRFYEHLGYDVLAECALDVGDGQCLKYWSGTKVLKP